MEEKNLKNTEKNTTDKLVLAKDNTENMITERQFLEVICRDYTSVYYVDLKNDVAEPIKMALRGNAVKMDRIQVRERIGYTATYRSYCNKFVTESNRKEFLHVMDRKFLLNVLTDTDRYIYRYESLPNPAGHKYFEVQIFRVREEDFDGKVIVGFHHIDDMVTKELRYQWELEKMVFTDALTGIGNRAAFTREMTAFDEQEKAACVIADVNNLKVGNDRYGHEEGDQLIQDAAECIREVFRESGTCYRIGGDEFCIMIREGDSARIVDCIQRLQRLTEEKNKNRKMPLTIACGYAIRENMQETMEQIFNRADEMMYDAKFRMKKEFPVYSEERIKNYLNVLRILCKSMDSYLYLWNISKDETWFFGDVDRNYAVRKKGSATNTTAEMVNITYPADRAALQADLEKIMAGEKNIHDMDYRWMNRQGEPVWINCRGTVIPDDKGKPFVMVGRVSDKSLRYLYHPLTKLFNKNKMFLDLKDQIMPQNIGFLMLMGIDNLGSINLRRGRSYGDEVIKKCAQVIEANGSVRNVWHVENNCYALYLDVRKQEDVRRIYDKILTELSDYCTLSAGVVANSKELFGDENNLYACAEMMLEKAKDIGIRNIVFFSQEDLTERLKTIQFMEEMQSSVRKDCEGFYLCYQPQIKTGNYHLFGAEVLLRYRSDTCGNIYPDEFIPLLEQSKLIKQVGMWILETALRQCKKWREIVPEFHISVNFSVVQLEDRDIAERVLDILNKVGIPGSALTIELTESIQIQSINQLLPIFKSWRDAGIELSIDDFGTGYASMSYLKQLDVNEIKIDKMFVRDVEEATYNYRLISNMIEFAKNSGMRVCCEGVEDMRELTVLEGLSPGLFQGYLFSKPRETESFEKAFIDSSAPEYQERQAFIQKIYDYKESMHFIYFNTKNILRDTNLGLWIIRLNKETGYAEMHADETMERIMGVDRKYNPQECYNYWHSRIREDHLDYVKENVAHMIEANVVVQLQYPWMHPFYGEVMVRCSGCRIEDSDGMITLEGYHRIISDIEER